MVCSFKFSNCGPACLDTSCCHLWLYFSSNCTDVSKHRHTNTVSKASDGVRFSYSYQHTRNHTFLATINPPHTPQNGDRRILSHVACCTLSLSLGSCTETVFNVCIAFASLGSNYEWWSCVFQRSLMTLLTLILWTDMACCVFQRSSMTLLTLWTRRTAASKTRRTESSCWTPSLLPVVSFLPL